MQRLESAVLEPDAFSYQHHMTAYGLTKAQAKAAVQEMIQMKVWKNDTYTVCVRDFEGVTHLSIKRNDREVIHDWRDLQEIKNQLCGTEREGLEIYPAESRRVDSANQYHVWVLPAGKMVPFGFRERLVINDPGGKAKQRPLEAA
jgi:hypothetical protein